MNEQRIRVCAEIQASEEGFGVLCLPALRGVARERRCDWARRQRLCPALLNAFYASLSASASRSRLRHKAQIKAESKLPKPDFEDASLSTRGPSTSTAPAVPRGLPGKTLGFKASGGVGFSFQP